MHCDDVSKPEGLCLHGVTGFAKSSPSIMRITSPRYTLRKVPHSLLVSVNRIHRRSCPRLLWQILRRLVRWSSIARLLQRALKTRMIVPLTVAIMGCPCLTTTTRLRLRFQTSLTTRCCGWCQILRFVSCANGNIASQTFGKCRLSCMYLTALHEISCTLLVLDMGVCCV